MRTINVYILICGKYVIIICLLQLGKMDMKEEFAKKVGNLEAKVAQLEGKLKHQELQLFYLMEEQVAVEKEESLSTNKSVESSSMTVDFQVKYLEGKLTRLEEKLEHQELQLRNLTEQLTEKERNLSKSFESSSDDRNNQQSNVIYRTCHEVRSRDSSLKSGMYWIDPDGTGVGDEPIRVHCNMATGN